MKHVRVATTIVFFTYMLMLAVLPGFTCSKNIPKDVSRTSSDYDLIAYKGTSGSRISYGNTLAECEELKSKLEEKNPDTVYRCRR